MTKTETNEINRKLKENYGRDFQDRPNFRLVFSADQFEKRYGEFEDWYGKVYLRSYNGVRTVPKYQESPPAWVLEKMERNVSTEIVDADISYEPLHVFKDKNGNPLEPYWRFVEIVISCLFKGPQKMSEELIYNSPESHEKEIQELYEIINNESPIIPTMLAQREAIVVPEINNGSNNSVGNADSNK